MNAAAGDAAPDPRLAGFRPLCLDCKYDLEGIPDGPCPECGLKFRYYGLQRRWIAMRQFRAWAVQVLVARTGAIMVLTALLWFGVYCSVAWMFPLLLAAWWGAVLTLRWSWASLFVRDAFLWLLALLPMLSMAAGASIASHPMLELAILSASSGVVAWWALRGSPLVAFLVLAPCVPGIMLVSSMLLLVNAYALKAGGHYWSDFDWPGPGRWAAMPVHRSILVGWCLLIVAVGLTGLMGMYLRRARVRLKHRNWS